MAKIEINAQPWQTPNYVILKFATTRTRQEGLVESPKLELRDVDADVLAQLCDEFRADIFRKAGKPDPAERTPTA